MLNYVIDYIFNWCTMEKNQIYKAEITGYNADGLGLCRIENMVI